MPEKRDLTLLTFNIDIKKANADARTTFAFELAKSNFRAVETRNTQRPPLKKFLRRFAAASLELGTAFLGFSCFGSSVFAS